MHSPRQFCPKAESCPEAAEGRNESKVLKNKHLGAKLEVEMSLGSRDYAGSLDRAGTRCRISNENILMSASSDRFKARSPIEASHS